LNRKTCVLPDDDGEDDDGACVILGMRPLPVAHDIGFSERAWGLLLYFAPPHELLSILAFLNFSGCFSNAQDLTMVENFCGVQSIVGAFQELGFAAVGFDINMSSLWHDLNLPTGFCAALQALRRLRRDGWGLQWFATVCSTWIWMCRASTGRRDTRPSGNESHHCIRMANRMVSRCCLLIIIGVALDIQWALEQPDSSLMVEYKSFVFIRKQFAQLGVDFLMTHCEMGAYSARSIKGTHLYSSSSWVHSLDRLASPSVRKALKGKMDVAKVHTDASGKRGVTGGKDLKKTQAYTRQFGRAVAGAWLAGPHQVHLDLPLLPDVPLAMDAAWNDAQLQDVLPYLMSKEKL
jgi:hypothetical protein